MGFAIFAAYVGTGALGLYAASLAVPVTLIWLPTGIAIGSALRYRNVGLVATFFAAATLNFVTSRHAGFALVAAIGNVAEAAVAAAVFRRFAPQARIASTRDAAGYFVACAIGCSAAAATGSAGIATLLAPEASPSALVRDWYLGDLVGAMLVGPMLLASDRRGRGDTSVSGLLRVACFLVTALESISYFANLPPSLKEFGELVAPVPVLLGTFCYGRRGAHGAATVVSMAAYVGRLVGSGPYSDLPLDTALESVWVLMFVLAGIALFVSSIVTERDDAKRTLADIDERFEALVENAADGLLLLDERRRVVLANPAARAMAGGRLRDDAWAMLEGPAARELREALGRAVKRGDRYVESRLLMAPGEIADDGREFAVRVTLLGAKDEFRGAAVLIEDVTERERRRRDHAELEVHLAASQRLESVGNLAGGIAHDFNNMLQAIQANLELTQLAHERGRDPREPVGRALEAAERARSLTRQLLAFSRRQPARFDRVDVLAVMRSSLAMLERLLPEDIHLVFTPRATDAHVRGDGGQLEQVLMNLIVNARDAMPGGGTLRIDVETERLEEPADAGIVRINVTDEGPGVPSEIRDRIFEPFFTTKSSGAGTGLGLAVVYGIVRSHGGSIRVEPAHPHGARFVVELPFIPPPSEEMPVEGARPSRSGAGQHVLLVEDDRWVRESTRDLLLAGGFRVTTAVHGRDALAVFDEAGDDIDVVLLDVVMPVMGGRETFERLRQIDPGIAVVFATGYSDEQIDVGFVRREQVPVVTKPYARDALVEVLLDAVASRVRSEPRS